MKRLVKSGEAMFGEVIVTWECSDILQELAKKYKLDLHKELIIKSVHEKLPSTKLHVERLKDACDNILDGVDWGEGTTSA